MPINFLCGSFGFLSRPNAVSPLSASSYVVNRVNNIEKSPKDTKKYRGVVLSNGLRVLLVQDPDTAWSNVALNVACGYMMDPWEIPGMAHLCEHMVSQGTEKYPDEKDFHEYIVSNGGTRNASTETDNTSFYFCAKSDTLEGALDRFVQFFIAPMFLEEVIERETCAIESELRNSANTDCWRIDEVVKSLFRHDDFGKFSIGSKESLLNEPRIKGLIIREQLIQFHQKWYSSNLMTVVITGKETLEELETMLGKVGFDRIHNKMVERRSWKNPLDEDLLGKVIKAVPIREVLWLKVIFPVPYLINEYRSHPYYYLAHLIGHVGRKSLFSNLQALGWVEKIHAHYTPLARGIANFQVIFELTEDGLANTEHILEQLFNYIGMLRISGLPLWIHEELRVYGRAHFLYEMDDTPLETAKMLASHLQSTSFEDILYSCYTMTEFRPDLIRSILDRLIPENMNYLLCSKTFAGKDGNEKEPISGAEMSVENISRETIQKLKHCLENPDKTFSLPEKNTHIPEKFDMKPLEGKSTEPHIIFDGPLTRVWCLQNGALKMPKMRTKVSISSPIVNQSPRTKLLAHLYLCCIQQTLNDEANPVLGGFSAEKVVTSTSIAWEIGGFSDKQPSLIQNLMQCMADFPTEDINFLSILDQVRRTLKNVAHSQPYKLCHDELIYLLLKEKFWGNEEMIAALSDITFSDVINFKKEFFKAFHVEIFLYGNIAKKEAIEMADKVSLMFQKASGERCRPPFVNECTPSGWHCLPMGTSTFYQHCQTSHDVNCVLATWQIGVQKIKDDAMVLLLVQLLDHAAFGQLRTKEQLGYIVSAWPTFDAGTSRIQIVVQGSTDPHLAMERIEAFLVNRRKEIQEMSKDAFRVEVRAVFNTLVGTPSSLKKPFKQYWNEIETRCYDFQRDRKRAEFLSKVRKDDLLRFFDERIAMNAPGRRMLAIFVHGCSDSGNDDSNKRKNRSVANDMREVETIEQFRSSLRLFERPIPAISITPFGVNPH